LPRFEERHPDVRVDLQLSYELADLERGDAHVAIRYGRGGYRGVRARRLFTETLLPVASPALARRLRRGSLWDAPLLSAGAAAPDAEGDMDWSAWSEGAGRPIPSTARYRRLRDYQRVVHCARAGQGVAVARLRLVAPLVDAGELVPVAEERVTGPNAHWFVSTEDVWATAPVRALHRWLRSQA
jgi:LysR family glycine cleavage system transcriptional activator